MCHTLHLFSGRVLHFSAVFRLRPIFCTALVLSQPTIFCNMAPLHAFRVTLRHETICDEPIESQSAGRNDGLLCSERSQE